MQEGASEDQKVTSYGQAGLQETLLQKTHKQNPTRSQWGACWGEKLGLHLAIVVGLPAASPGSILS